MNFSNFSTKVLKKRLRGKRSLCVRLLKGSAYMHGHDDMFEVLITLGM